MNHGSVEDTNVVHESGDIESSSAVVASSRDRVRDEIGDERLVRQRRM